MVDEELEEDASFGLKMDGISFVVGQDSGDYYVREVILETFLLDPSAHLSGAAVVTFD